MRYSHLIFVIALLPCAGCTAVFTESGKNLAKFATRDQVRRDFGEPTTVGISEGQPYEEFRTRYKIAEPEK